MKKYKAPEIKVVNIDNEAILAASPMITSGGPKDGIWESDANDLELDFDEE